MMVDRPEPAHRCDTCKTIYNGVPTDEAPCQQPNCEGTLKRLVRDKAFWEEMFEQDGTYVRS